MLVAPDKFHAVAVGIADEDDAGAASRGVGLAPENYAAPAASSVLACGGEVAVAFTRSLGLLAEELEAALLPG